MSASLSTHVLDVERGEPARGILVELYRGNDVLATAETDAEGRVGDLAGPLEPGEYRLVFHPPSPLFRRIELELALEDRHHHVPLLVSSYSCVTYRGS
ncbi:MAG: hydroxyisourate hydrolase [Gaiellaceae bacterium]